jgi:hypothetical protein
MDFCKCDKIRFGIESVDFLRRWDWFDARRLVSSALKNIHVSWNAILQNHFEIKLKSRCECKKTASKNPIKLLIKLSSKLH